MNKKIKRRPRKSIVVVLILIIIAIFMMPYVMEFTDTTSEYKEAVMIEIPQGATGEDIGDILKEHKLIKSSLIFRVKAKMSPDGSKMNYGKFTLYKGMCIDDIIKTLAGTFSYKETVKLTVPEGFSIEQIGKRCEELGLFTKEEFFQAVENTKHDYEVNEGVKFELQGYLYPETYEFFTDATPEDVIDTLSDQYEKVRGEIKKDDIKVDRDWKDIMIIASLIEREALLDSEMATISGVIYNRLEIGMRLQVDAAVQYAVSDGYYNVNRITYDDLEIESPYNTYKVDALPVGPICNPGINAILAACNPEEHDYLYYHTDLEKNDGSHIFTKTYDEHMKTQ